MSVLFLADGAESATGKSQTPSDLFGTAIGKERKGATPSHLFRGVNRSEAFSHIALREAEQ